MIKLKFYFWLLSKYCYWHDVLFTMVDNSQLRLWNKAVNKKEEVEYMLHMAEKHTKGSVDSWDDLG